VFMIEIETELLCVCVKKRRSYCVCMGEIETKLLCVCERDTTFLCV